MMPAKPTNKDILTAVLELGQKQVAQGALLQETHNLAVKTNGRVTELEKKSISYDAIQEYKNRYEKKRQFDITTIIALAAAAAAVVGLVIGVN